MSTGSAGQVGGDAVKGAAIGAPLGPYGAVAGGILGAGYGLLDGGPSDAQKAADAASAAHVAQEKQNAIALENYRQSARQQYHQLLLNQMQAYQGSSNALASITGGHGGMSTAGQSWNDDPLTLAQTGIGAPQGSNYAGYTDNSGPGGTLMQHQGIGAYVNGTARDNVTNQTPNGTAYSTETHTPFKVVSYTSAVPGGGLDPVQGNYSPGPVAPPTNVPTAGLSFAPRRV